MVKIHIVGEDVVPQAFPQSPHAVAAPFQVLVDEKESPPKLIAHGQVAPGHVAIEPPADQLVDRRLGKMDRQGGFPGVKLINDELVKPCAEAVEEVKEKRTGQQFAVIFSISGDVRSVLIFKSADMGANLGDGLFESRVLRRICEKTSDFMIHVVPANTERIGVNSLMNQVKEMAFC